MPDGPSGSTHAITHPACDIQRTRVAIPEDGQINGLIKIHLWKEKRREQQSAGLADRLPMRYQESVPASSTPEDVQLHSDAIEDDAAEDATQPRDTRFTIRRSVPSSVCYLPEAFGARARRD